MSESEVVLGPLGNVLWYDGRSNPVRAPIRQNNRYNGYRELYKRLNEQTVEELLRYFGGKDGAKRLNRIYERLTTDEPNNGEGEEGLRVLKTLVEAHYSVFKRKPQKYDVERAIENLRDLYTSNVTLMGDRYWN